MKYNETTQQFDIFNNQGKCVNSADNWEVALVETFENVSPSFDDLTEWVDEVVCNTDSSYRHFYEVAKDYVDFDKGSDDWRLWVLWGYFMNEWSDAPPPSSIDGETVTFGKKEYLVLTEDEADKKTKEYIRESVWAFNASFISGHTGLSEEFLSAVQEALCEDANEGLVEILERFEVWDDFMSEAISADGRGHFLAHYDSEEHEGPDDSYIYRVN
jgi:hypothetical protein